MFGGRGSVFITILMGARSAIGSGTHVLDVPSNRLYQDLDLLKPNLDAHKQSVLSIGSGKSSSYRPCRLVAKHRMINVFFLDNQHFNTSLGLENKYFPLDRRNMCIFCFGLSGNDCI